MPRSIALALAAAGLALAPPARAGLHIDAPATYRPGDLVTVTLTGDSEGMTATISRALLNVDSTLVYVSGAAGTLNDSSPSFLWEQTAAVGTCGSPLSSSNACTALDAYSYLSGGTFALDLLPSTLSTFTFDTTNAIGDLLFQLDPDGAGFFGLPGTTAVVALVPEPATALLVALGLAGLARRRRIARR